MLIYFLEITDVQWKLESYQILYDTAQFWATNVHLRVSRKKFQSKGTEMTKFFLRGRSLITLCKKMRFQTSPLVSKSPQRKISFV